jgi:uncharacterized protein (TIGR00730 family)
MTITSISSGRRQKSRQVAKDAAKGAAKHPKESGAATAPPRADSARAGKAKEKSSGKPRVGGEPQEERTGDAARHFQRYVRPGPAPGAQSEPSARPGLQEVPQATSLVDLRARAEQDTLDGIFRKHLVDFRVAFAELRQHAPSVVFFGGARLKPEDKYYKLAQDFGAALVPRGIPPKTGAGPGAMHAVPDHFIATRDHMTSRAVQSLIAGISRYADLSDQRTLGFNIKLPAEQHTSPAIESATEIQQFAFRKFALYENVRGIVVFPGGFGTIDELMEVLILKREGRTKDPIVLAGKEYWQPILDAWKSAAQRNGVDLLANLLDDVLVTDSPDEALDFIEGHKDVRAFEHEPDELYKRMVRELHLARYVATRQTTAVTVLGGESLSKDDSALDVVRALAPLVEEAGSPLRVGQSGQVKEALERGGANVQSVLWEAEGPRRSSRLDIDNVTFRERIPHKEVLLRNSSAYVVLPCADRGKDELCTVLCQIQTGKLPRRPLVLVDEAYWKPIVEAWQQQMLGENHAYIDPSDIALVTYANTADEAMGALRSAL